MRREIRMLSLLLAFLLAASNMETVSFAAPEEGSVNPAEAESGQVSEEIYIRTVEDFLTLSENGTGEEYTIDKTFILENDLDFSGRIFMPVPVFSGVFDGKHHQVKGITYKEDGSDLGLFRFIGEKGLVKNLNVSASLQPQGEMSTVGGVAGTNKGRIENCAFEGEIKGRQILGGIAGVNDETGVIYRSVNKAAVTGTKNIGGAAGINKGRIENASNRGHINATSETIPAEEMDAEKAINITDYLEDSTKIENIGGIAGLNEDTGVIGSSFNYEEVGYAHMGYCVGGICGMQKGYVLACENKALIRGRKDIGGIAGAFSPYVFINYEDDLFDLMENQFDLLSGELDNLEAYADLLDDDLYAGSQEIRLDIDDLRDQLREYKDYYREKGRLIDLENDYEMDQIVEKIDKIETNLKLEELAKEGERLKDQYTSMTALKLALEGLVDSDTLTDSLKSQVEQVRQALKEAILKQAEAAGQELSEEALEAMAAARLQPTLADLGITYDPETGSVTAVSGNASETMKKSLVQVLNQMEGTLDDMLDILKSDAGQSTTLKNRLEDLRDRGERLRDFLDTQQEALRKDVDETDETLTELDDALSDALTDTLDKFDEDKSKVRGQLHTIRDRSRNIRHTAEDEVKRYRQRLRDKEFYYDISDTEDDKEEAGKIIQCGNLGEIEADVNGGGVAGRIAIDFSSRSGLSITENGDETLNFEQDVRALVLSCKNYSDVSVKNSYAGGILGKADYGAVIRCENYGNISAEGGDYAGGIAGRSDYRIRNCYCLCNVSASDYAGGIAGYGKDIYDNTAMASAETFKGAKAGTIAGDVDSEGRVSGNIYVQESQGAVNNVTYITQAEGISYYRLIQDEATPSDFYRFQVRFVSDGEILKSIVYDYGEKVEEQDIPPIPKK
ncbi:MAG: hypothetical protein IJU50_08080, partial [Lachnospiraceae bacterium]|nr:hypothetical protein [Lachnospiraceae bacterium]